MRDQGIFTALQAITVAARESSIAVLEALNASLRALVPDLTDILVYLPELDDLRCIFTNGNRAEWFFGSRIRRDRFDLLPALASQCGHRVTLPMGKAVIPGDRWAISVPMALEAGAPVFYASSYKMLPEGQDAVAALALHSGVPYLIAAEREADRARATFDALTGLLTPRAFRERLAEEIADATLARSRSIALWFIDTDNFKQVNDAKGHAAGDAVLQRVAAILRAHVVPESDVAARNGGDEFCAIVRGIEKIAAIDRAQHFCDAMRSADFAVGIPITASVGVAVYPYDAQDAPALLEAADAAMYHSKNSGRDRVSFLSAPATFATYR